MENIEGVIIKRLLVHKDDRGNFREILKVSEGMMPSIKQISMSTTKPRIIKAFHWHKFQDDIFYAVKGNVKVVLYDPRPESRTHGKTQVIFMGEDYEPHIALIPRGVYHGYQVIGSKDAEMLYIMNNEYNASLPDEERVDQDDPRVNFNWNESISKKNKKKILLIGASGMLGKQLMRDFSKEFNVTGTYNKKEKTGLIHLDITNKLEVSQVIEREAPDIVVLASAKTNVEQCELEPDDTYKTNVEGVRNVVQSVGNRLLIFISTEAIFDGTKKEYYEDDSANPLNIYGRSKLEGELIVKTLPNYLICRTCRLYTSERTSPKFMNMIINNLREGKSVKTPVETNGNASFVEDVSSAILQLIRKGTRGVYHVCSPDSNSFYNTALKIAEIFNADSSLVIPVDKDHFNTKVKRQSSVLKITKLLGEGIKMRTLDEGLKEVKRYQDSYKPLISCRVCGSSELISYLDLGETPLANSFLKDKDEKEDYFPLNVVYCNSCSFSQLNSIVSPEIMFSEYVYRSSISNTFKAHCTEMSDELKNSNFIKNGDLVVDIASNDGTLLAPFKNSGMRVLGVEPARNMALIANENKIETIQDYWNPKLADKINQKYGPAKIITAFNVFAHVNDMHSFIAGAKKLLSKEGYLIIESPHILPLMEHTEFDTVYHEHLSYLLLKPLIQLMNVHGMRIARVKEYDIHGGSIRMYIEHSYDSDTSDGSVQKIIEKENSMGLYSKESYLSFGKRVEKLKSDLLSLLKNIKSDGKSISGFGASAKGNTLLNYFGIGTDFIDCIFDSTPEKQNKLTPGTHIPVVSPDKLSEVKPDYLLILPWNFSKEIMDKNKSFKEQGGSFIIPIPEVKVI